MANITINQLSSASRNDLKSSIMLIADSTTSENKNVTYQTIIDTLSADFQLVAREAAINSTINLSVNDLQSQLTTNSTNINQLSAKAATSNDLGLIKLSSDARLNPADSKVYPVQLDKDGLHNALVYVPWESVGSGILDGYTELTDVVNTLSTNLYYIFDNNSAWPSNTDKLRILSAAVNNISDNYYSVIPDITFKANDLSLTIYGYDIELTSGGSQHISGLFDQLDELSTTVDEIKPQNIYLIKTISSTEDISILSTETSAITLDIIDINGYMPLNIVNCQISSSSLSMTIGNRYIDRQTNKEISTLVVTLTNNSTKTITDRLSVDVLCIKSDMI